jgi:hypothetical protein
MLHRFIVVSYLAGMASSEEQYGGNIDWTQIWTKLKKIKVTNKVKEFQWKCLHNINYTEHRLKKNEFVKRKMPSVPNKKQR